MNPSLTAQAPMPPTAQGGAAPQLPALPLSMSRAVPPKSPIPIDTSTLNPSKPAFRIPSFPGFTDKRYGPAIQDFLEKCDTSPNTKVQLLIERTKLMVDGAQDMVADPTRLDGYRPSAVKTANKLTQNFMKSDGLKFIAMLSNNSPDAKVVAENPEDINSIMAAETADDVLQESFREIDLPAQLAEVAQIYWEAGTVYTHVYLKATDKLVDVEHLDIADPTKTAGPADSAPVDPMQYYNEMEVDPNAIVEGMINGPDSNLDSDIEPVTQDQFQSGQPQRDVEQVQEFTVGVYNTTAREVTIPDREKDVKDLPWLRFDQEFFIGKIIEEYGDQAKFLTQSAAYSNSGGDKLPTVQLQAKSLRISTDMRSNSRDGYEVVTKLFLAPVAYHILKDQHGALFLADYPDGACIHICQNRVLRISHAVLADHWVIKSPDLDKRLCVKPKAHEIESTQLGINTSLNYALRSLHRNVPTTIIDSTLVSPATLAAHRNNAFDLLRVNSKGQDISKYIANVPTAVLPKELVPFVQMLRATSQEIDGITPPVFGGGAPASTFREGESRRNAAMGQSTLTFKSNQAWVYEVSEKLLRIKAQYGVQNIRKGKREILVHLDLKLNGWKVEVAPDIPVSDIEAADSLREILSQNSPEILQTLEVTSPANRARMFRLLKLKGFESMAADLNAYCEMVLEDLLSNPPSPDPQSGLIYPPVRPNPDIEDPAAMIAYMITWIQKPKGGLSMRKRNPEGYANVCRYVALYKGILQMQQQQAAMEQMQMGVPPDGAGPSAGPGAGGPPGPAPAPPGMPEPGGRPTTAPPPGQPEPPPIPPQ